jgi:hypothetical protein
MLIMSKDVITFSALAVLTGKGVTGADKARQHLANGASAGALIAAGVQRKALLSAVTAEAVDATVRALAGGNIRPAAALVVAKSGKAVSLLEVNGKAPYSEWLRLGAALGAMVQVTKAGKATTAAKALALWQEYHDAAQAIRNARESQKAIADAGLTETETPAETVTG